MEKLRKSYKGLQYRKDIKRSTSKTSNPNSLQKTKELFLAKYL